MRRAWRSAGRAPIENSGQPDPRGGRSIGWAFRGHRSAGEMRSELTRREGGLFWRRREWQRGLVWIRMVGDLLEDARGPPRHLERRLRLGQLGGNHRLQALVAGQPEHV